VSDGRPGRVAAPAGTGSAGAALVVVVLVLAGAIFWLVRLPGPADVLAAPAEPVVVPAGSTDGTVERPVQVRVELGPALTSFSAIPGGVVTGVRVGPGDAVRTGTPLVEVDGVTRVAAHVRRPFFRALGLGDRGTDVDQLAALLAQLRVSTGQHRRGARFDAAMAAGVRRVARSLGAPQDGAFDPSWVVWLPEPELVVSSVQAQVGGPVPGAGQPLVSYAPTVRSAVVAGYVPDAGPVVSDELMVRGVSTAHLRLRDGRVLLDAASRSALDAAVAAAEPTDAPAGSEVGAATRRSVTVGAVRVTHWRTGVVTVPVAAVVTGAGAGACVLVQSGTDWRAAAVRVLGSDPGTLQAEVSGLDARVRLVANPEAAGIAGRCREGA
jgi:hypothetical protein